jgi:hypothetical protein
MRRKNLVIKNFLAILFLTILGYIPSSFAVMFDFESPSVAGLDGLVSGSLFVDGINVDIQAGQFDQTTNTFTMGGSGATLAVIPPGTITGFGAYGGLGIDSSLPSGTNAELAHGVSLSEGIQFSFDKDVVIENIILPTAGIIGVRVLADGVLYGDFTGSSDETLSLNIGYAVSSLLLAPITDMGLSSDPVFLVTALTATTVPEPATLVIFILGCVLLSRLMMKKDYNQLP